MVNISSKRLEDILRFAILVLALVVLNQVMQFFTLRLDLTEEKRYTISDASIQMLSDLESTVFVDVYLEGDLPAGFKRLQKSIRETLDEFKVYAGDNLQYNFIDPSTAGSQQARNEFYYSLAQRGIQPTNLYDNKDGSRTEKIIFPGAILSAKGREKGIVLLKGNKRASSQEQLNQSIEGLEFELISAIKELTQNTKKHVGFITGHNELDDIKISGFQSILQQHYIISKTTLRNNLIATYDALILAQPKKPLNEKDKYYLDQYVMGGGKVLFFIDALAVEQDSAGGEGTLAFPVELNLDDMMFKYGVRINKDYVVDLSAAPKPVVVGNMGDKPQVQLLPWPFYPLAINFSQHPITRNLDAVSTRFISSMDTVKASGITKTPLMFSSEYSKVLKAPIKVSLNDLREEMKPEYFTSGTLPMAWLLEGKFTSLYKNRFLPDGVNKDDFKSDGLENRLLVVADADLLINEINPQNGQPYELGFDPFARTQYANADFLINALSYMVDDDGIILSRTKEIKIRPLNQVKIDEERQFYQILNLALPIALILIFAVIKSIIRKKRFATQK